MFQWLFPRFRVYRGVAKYKGGFDVPKPYTPVGFEGESWRQVSDTCKNNFATLNPLNHNKNICKWKFNHIRTCCKWCSD